MRLSNMNPYNEKRTDYFGYGVMAVLCGFVFYFFINVFARIGLALVKVAYRYWWASLIILVLFIFIKRRRRKK